jgi:GT2 family glycosyltransferase
MSNPLLYVVILNSSRRDDVIPCLTSLFQSDYKHFKVILADDASTADSLEIIRREFPQVQIIHLTSNLGYAGNNNIGIRAAMEQGAEWILLLNDDTVLDAARPS